MDASTVFQASFQMAISAQSDAENMDIFTRISHWKSRESELHKDFIECIGRPPQSPQENSGHNVNAFFAPADALLLH